jgi:type VI secretion system protein ImpC
MRFDVELGSQRSAGQRTRKESMRVLIVGDLMGASAWDALPVAQRPIVPISVEAFDEVFARFEPSVALPALGLPSPHAFKELDDFHPDKLFEKVEIFDRFRTLRRRLQDPSTFGAAADELRLEAGTSRLSSAPRETNRSHAKGSVEAFIRSLVAPHIVSGNDPQLPQILSAVDAAIADTMRSLLHDTAFQRLEATWRGVHWLLAGTGDVGDGDLEISLLHLTREELSAHARPASALELRQARGADATPWSLVVADFSFGPSKAI